MAVDKDSTQEDRKTDVPLFMTSPGRAASEAAPRVTAIVSDSARHTLKTAVHNELIKRMDLAKLAEIQADAISGRQRLFTVILQLIGEQSIRLSTSDRDSLAKEVLDEIFGLGPLEPLLHDPTVNDILVNTYTTVYVERRGVIEKTNVVFKDNAHLMHIIDKIVSAVGRRIDESAPMVDARLLDGSRVNIVIPPLAVDGPLLSIRRFGKTPLTAEDLLRYRALTPQMLEMLTQRGARAASTSSSPAAPAPARPRCSMCSPASSPQPSASSPSKTPPNCRSSRSTSPVSNAARPTSKAKAPYASANWSSTRCACAPTASSSARCAARRPSTCCRP